MSRAVPEGWSRHKLSDSLNSLPKSKLPSRESDPRGYYDFYVCSQKVLKSFHNQHSSPAILFSTGGRAAVHFATGQYSFSTDVWAIKLEGELCNEYAICLLEELSEKINYSGFQGSGIKHLDKSFIEKLEFSIPPLLEQKKIASILASVNEVIESTQKQINKLQDFKKATMSELLTKGIGHAKYKESSVGRIPKKWEVKALTDISKNLDSKRIPIKSSERANIKGKYRYYGASGIIDYIDDYIFDGEYILLGEDGENVVSRNSPLAFIVKGKYWVNNHAHVIEPNNGMDIGYLCEYLESLDYKNIASGSAQPKITQGSLNLIKVPIPSEAEQKEIGDTFRTLDKEIKIKNKKLIQQTTLKKALMQDLLTGKVRVAIN